MNPFYVEIAGSISRWGLALLAGYVVKAGVLTQADAEKYIASASLALVALGWSVWQKKKMRTKVVTAISSPEVKTEKQLEAKIANPATDNPSVLTPKDEVPK